MTQDISAVSALAAASQGSLMPSNAIFHAYKDIFKGNDVQAHASRLTEVSQNGYLLSWGPELDAEGNIKVIKDRAALWTLYVDIPSVPGKQLLAARCSEQLKAAVDARIGI